MNYDFSFDGKLLSSFGCMVTSFDGTGNNTLSLGGKTEFSTALPSGSNQLQFYGSRHTEQLSATIQISKTNLQTNDYFTLDEARALSRWLNRSDGYKKLFFDVDGSFEDNPVYYMAQIQISAVTVCDKIAGFELEITTDRPWGNIDKSISGSTSSSVPLTVNNDSDELGEIPCSLTVNVKNTGDLTITNSRYETGIKITGCITGEIITLDGKNQIITSNKPNLASRFNWEYPKLLNSEDNNINLITTSIPCTVQCNWVENRKEGIGL